MKTTSRQQISKAEALAANLRKIDERIAARVWVGGDTVRVYLTGSRSYAGRVSGYYQIDAATLKATSYAKHPGSVDWAAVRAAMVLAAPAPVAVAAPAYCTTTTVTAETMNAWLAENQKMSGISTGYSSPEDAHARRHGAEEDGR